MPLILRICYVFVRFLQLTLDGDQIMESANELGQSDKDILKIRQQTSTEAKTVGSVFLPDFLLFIHPDVVSTHRNSSDSNKRKLLK